MGRGAGAAQTPSFSGSSSFAIYLSIFNPHGLSQVGDGMGRFAQALPGKTTKPTKMKPNKTQQILEFFAHWVQLRGPRGWTRGTPPTIWPRDFPSWVTPRTCKAQDGLEGRFFFPILVAFTPTSSWV